VFFSFGGGDGSVGNDVSHHFWPLASVDSSDGGASHHNRRRLGRTLGGGRGVGAASCPADAVERATHRKRFRTKFTAKQKLRMQELAVGAARVVAAEARRGHRRRVVS
jgi:hypothetical protein